MADLSAVMEALKTLVTSAIYPNAPAVTGGSAVGVDALIGIGWPDDAELLNTLNAGQAFIGIFPLDGERNVTLWEYGDQEVPRSPPGIAAVFDPAALTITLSGLAAAGDVIGVVYDGTAYTVDLLAGQTPAVIAAAIAAAIPGQLASVTGNVVSFVYAPDLALQVGSNGQSMRNVGSIERRLQVNIWSFDQPSRDALFALLIGAVQDAQFLLVPVPNSAAIEAVKLSYSSSTWSDKPQNAGGYLRGLVALVDFQTTIYNTAYQILFTGSTLNNVYFGPL